MMDNDDWNDLKAEGRARMAELIAETVSKLDTLKYPQPTAPTDHWREHLSRMRGILSQPATTSLIITALKRRWGNEKWN